MCTWFRELALVSQEPESVIPSLTRKDEITIQNSEHGFNKGRYELKSRALHYLILAISAWGFYWGSLALTESSAALRNF
jgi:hypothetical protein